MSTIKQVLLGAAVAGVVAGTGSAVSAGIAYADPSADSNTSAGASDASSAPSRGAGRTHTRTNAGKPAPAAATPTRAARESAVVDEIPTAIPGNNDNPPAVSASQPAETPASQPTAPAPAAAAVPAPAAPVAAPAPASTVATAANNSAPASAAAAPAPAAAAEPVVTVAVPAAVVVAEPAPAAPAPTPVRLPLLPLLPTLPAVPVGPASAVTVSATSGANTRLRAASAVAQAEVLSDPPPATHVLLIGVDGTNLNKILQYTWDNPDSTGFQELMEDGTTSATSIVGHTTISGPSWTTILTGVWDNKSGVINNLFNPKPYHDWPTVFNMLENYNTGIDTAVVADWKYINDIAASGVNPVQTEDNHYITFDTSWADTDQLVTDKTIDLIGAADPNTPTFIMSYQVQVDEAGHGFGGGSAEYRDAVINVGQNIAEIMDAVHAAELATGEDWTVIVTTDHGHQQSKGFGHGFQSPNETSSFIIFDQAGDASGGKQNQAFSNADITPTIVNMFGAPMRSDFDGVPLDTKGSGLVTPVDLETSLNNAISMYGYPNIGVDVALGVRTVFATVPYVIDGFVNNVTSMLQTVIDKDIFLISGIAKITQWIVQFNGDLAVGVTQAIATVVAHLTGSGVIPPTDPPLTPNTSGDSELTLLNGDLVLT